MKLHIKSAVFFVILVMASACAVHTTGEKTSAGTSIVHGKPIWYWTPSQNGVTGGIGESGLHVNGPSAQRQLAVSRALDDIARQKGIKVQNTQEIAQQVNNLNEGSTTLSSYSLQTVDGVTVKAIVREVWQDPQTKRIYVWVTEIK